ncbi:MAG: hypothetical protein GY928_11440 [Colwellia sp.]|nr:hypothetical protein [Colwellia sp.]
MRDPYKRFMTGKITAAEMKEEYRVLHNEAIEKTRLDLSPKARNDINYKFDGEEFVEVEKAEEQENAKEQAMNTDPKEDKIKKMTAYNFKPITYPDGTMDHYCYMASLGGLDSSIDHAVKKLSFAGDRGVKGKLKDWKEAIRSIEQAILREENNA